MPNPQKPTLDYSYVSFQQANQDSPFPGSRIDNDLANLKHGIDSTIDALKDVRRADGKLPNNIVDADALDNDLLIGLKTPVAWESGKAYRELDTVYVEDTDFYGLYRCDVSHESALTFQEDLDAGYWELIFNFGGVQEAATEARDKARQWATNPVDDPVETDPNEFSALHHATKAAASASSAAGSASSALSSKTAAADSADTATAAAGTATGAAGTAQTSAGQAMTAASNAATSAEEAEAAADGVNVVRGVTTTAIADTAIPSSTREFTTSGYAEPGDGGGAQWVELDTVPDPVMPWQRVSGNGRAFQISDAVLDAAMFGVAGQSTDNTAAANNAADAARALARKLVFAKGAYDYTAESPIDFQHVELDIGGARFNLLKEGIGVIGGGNASTGMNPTQVFGVIERPNIYVNPDHPDASPKNGKVPTLRIVGAKGQKNSIVFTNFVQLWADTSEGVRDNDFSSAYFRFDWGWVIDIELTGNPDNFDGPTNGGVGGQVQWINQGIITCARCSGVYSRGPYNFNGLTFVGLTLENEAVIDLDAGHDIIFDGPRLENGPHTFRLGPETFNIGIVGAWSSNRRGKGAVEGLDYVLDDQGAGNYVGDKRLAFVERVNLLAVNSVTCRSFRQFDGNGGIGTPQTTLAGVTTQVAGIDSFYRDDGSFIWRSPRIPVFPGFELFVRAEGNLRYRARLYTADGTRMTTSTHPDINDGDTVTNPYLVRSPQISSYSDDADFGFYNGFAVPELQLRIRGQEPAFIEVDICGSGQVFDAFEVFAIVPRGKTHKYQSFQAFSIPAYTSAPIRGWAAYGFKISNPTGGWFTVSGGRITSTTSSASSGVGSVDVATAVGTSVGDVIGLEYDGNNAHWTTVSSVSGNTLGLTAALPADIANGARVAITKWTSS